MTEPWHAGWRCRIDQLAPRAELVLVDERGYVEGCDHRPVPCAVWLIHVDGRLVGWPSSRKTPSRKNKYAQMVTQTEHT